MQVNKMLVRTTPSSLHITGVIHHNVYVLHLSSLDDKYRCHFEVLDQKKICGNISPVVRGPWIEELALQNITFSDIDSYGPIDVLIGADVAGNLWTGGHKALDCKLVAVETKLGWTLMGKIPNKQRSKQDATSLVTSMLTTGKISDLWTLDTLGILDPYEKCSRQELEAETQKTFLETVKITKEGRFEVRLPWMADHSPLSDNYDLAKKRLSSTVKKLKKEATDLNQRLRYRQKLKQNLRERFRSEYLGQLQLHGNKKKPYELKVGEIVLIGGDGVKRLNWPLAQVVELTKGKDGNVRLVRLRTQNGELMRPVQRIFPLEINSQEDNITQEHLRQVANEENSRSTTIREIPPEEDVSNVEPVSITKETRRGRVICVPKRYRN